MSVGVVANDAAVSNISSNGSSKLEILSEIKNKLLDGVKNLTEGHFRKLATLGQIAGVIGIATGALALIGTGVCSSVSGLGLPVGIALVCVGGALLLGGTAFAIVAAKKNENNTTIGDLVKDVFSQTVENVKKGIKFSSSITKFDMTSKADSVLSPLEKYLGKSNEVAEETSANQTTQQTSVDKAVEQKKQEIVEDLSARSVVENLL